MSNVPALLIKLPPPPPILPVPVKVAVVSAAIFSVREPMFFELLPLIVSPPLACVTPPPVIVPPVQLRRPVTVSVPVPLKLPPLRFSRFVVAALSKLAVPLLIDVVPLTLYVPPIFTVAPENKIVPAAVTLEGAVSVYVPPLKSSVARLAAEKLPLPVPPVLSLIVPVFTVSVPLLFNAQTPPNSVTSVPAVFCSVPALLKTAEPPNALTKSASV